MAKARRAVDPAQHVGGGVTPPPTQRIDRFLWFARLSGDRSTAQVLAERGIVRLNGRRIERAHTPVRPGDLLTLPIADNVRVIRILVLPVRRGPAPEARTMYEIIEPGESNPGYAP